MSVVSVSLLIGYLIIGITCLFTVYYIIRNRKKYGIKLIPILNAVFAVNVGLISSTFYIFSVVFFISPEVNTALWKLSIISGIGSLFIISILYSFFLQYGKIPILPFLFFILLGGLLIGILFRTDSILIETEISGTPLIFISDPTSINYIFSPLTSSVLITFQVSTMVYFFYIAYIVYLKTKKKKETLPLIINMILLFIPIFIYLMYILTAQTLYRELYIILIWISTFSLCVMLIKKPEMFYILPNRIYAINIYHKSGILLYSYNVEGSSSIKNEPAIWGNILIGLNHILSEFIDKTDKIDVLQTRNSDIIVHYDEELSYAIVIITNRKNVIVERLLNSFSEEFKNQYRDELVQILDLNRIIDVAEFNDAKTLIERNFRLYL